MDELDEKIKTHYNLGKRSDLSKCLKFLKIRTALDLKYEILKNRRYANPISYSQIMNKKLEKTKLGTTVNLEFKEVGKISEVGDLVGEKLLEDGFKVVKSGKKQYSFIVSGSLATEKQHFNVKGFVKYKFLLSIKSKNGRGEQIGSVSHTVLQTGRSFIQTYSKAVPSIKRFINENLDQLNMD